MNPFDSKLLEKFRELENLDAIEARLAGQERKSRVTLIVIMILALSDFALLLRDILGSSWLPLGH
jgi:hypothetical protein